MKKTLLSLSAVLMLFAACKKEDKASPSGGGGPISGGGSGGGGTTIPKSPYYYNLNFGGKDYNISGSDPQYMAFTSQLGGYQVPSGGLYPSASLSFEFDGFRTVPHAEVMAFAGKTFYFDWEAKVHPLITFQNDFDSTTWSSYDTLDKQFYIQIDSVRYLHPDTIVAKPIDVYVISGSCNVLMTRWEEPPVIIPLKNGKFHFMISRAIND